MVGFADDEVQMLLGDAAPVRKGARIIPAVAAGHKTGH
jgi:hypothetical protein